MKSKKCNRCSELKGLTEFTKDRSKKDGLRTICRGCSKIRPINPKARNPEFDVKEITEGGGVKKVKKCNKCLVTKDVVEFNKSGHCAGGVAPRCKKCLGAKGLFKHAKLTKIRVNDELVDAKDCGMCLEIKPLTSFAVIKGKRKGIGGRYSKCNDCERAYRSELMKDEDRQIRTFRVRRKYESGYQERRRELYRINIEKERERSKVKDANRFALNSKLRNDLSTTQYAGVLNKFNQSCALTGNKENITLDHFIPLWTGHGGTYVGNVYPLKDTLNYSKSNANPFEWGGKICNEGDFECGKLGELISYLSKENGMSVEEFELFVNWCFENRRKPEDIELGAETSIELFRRHRAGTLCR